MTLVVGGHVDKPPSYPSETSLFFDTLRRELDEEVGVRGLPETDPIGIVIDSSSIFASRHIALVYEVVLQNDISLRAKEEFAVHSKFSGRFFTPAELSQFHGMFDPWSLILFEDYIAPSSAKKPQQYALPFHSIS
jgi:predicted NUDIX family phosphoesterase